jgi:hypothetical protein
MQYIEKKIHGSWLLYVGPKLCSLQYVVPKRLPCGVVVQWLKIWLFNVEVRSSSPHTYNLGYLGYLSDLIK